MLALYFVAQFLGIVTPVEMVERVYWVCTPTWYNIGGMVFIVLGILDFWTFQFNPMQINIYLDQTTQDES